MRVYANGLFKRCSSFTPLVFRYGLRNLANFVNKNLDPIAQRLEAALGTASVSTKLPVREQHSHDEGHHSNKLPDIVVFPKCVNEVSAILRICNENRVPIIPFGSGTGLEGGVNAVFGGVAVNLMSMNNILAINEEDFDCRVEPGVTRKSLNTRLRDTGLWFSVDPGADASVGGMVATGASGTNTVRYGAILQNVLNLQLVLPNGEILHTNGKGRRQRKTSAGFNLTELIVGSEGTLGIITEVTVKLHARPSYCSAAICSFSNVHKAVEAVVTILQSSIPIARIEFLDDNAIKACNQFSKLSLLEQSTLFLEFHGNTDEEVKSQAEFVGEICAENGGAEFQWSHLTEEMDNLWTARHNAYYAIVSMKKGSKGFSTDACVPLSRLADVITMTKEDIDKSGLFGAIVGHVGDGNFHCMFPVDPSNRDEMNIIWQLSDRVVMRALAAEGTCTGEHGIGLGKRKYITKELNDVGVSTMRLIKNAFDPNGIMNPGKVLP